MGIGENNGEGIGENTGESSRRIIIPPEGNLIRDIGWDVQSVGELGGIRFYPAPAQGSSEDAFDELMNSSTSFHSNEQSHSGGQSCKMTYNAGSTGDAGWGGNFNFTPVPYGSEYWVRVWFFFPLGWDYGGGAKWIRVHIEGPGTTNQGYLDMYLKSDSIRCQCEPSDFAQVVIPSVIPDDVRGRWVAMEQYVNLVEGSSGIWRCWWDGELIFDSNLDAMWTSGVWDGGGGASWPSGVPNYVCNSTSSYIRQVRIHTQMNTGHATTQSDYIDDVIITKETPNQIDASGNPFIGI